ncbi:MAG TPA: hypothetical protein VGN46_19865 [Luteibacter sp.]|jgi:hypothetical protein|uniref:hypothetical protein n=1 Tax=Luteibacter sp. TaxID=1886636 RepID=UPI002F4268AA
MNSPDTGTTVYYTPDPDAPLSPEAIAELRALRDRPIDFSDIPPKVIDETWYRPKWAIDIARQKVASGSGDPAIERMLKAYDAGFRTALPIG